MAIEEVDEFTPVVRKLRGSTLKIPDLKPLYARWRQGFNFHYDRLVDVINRQLEVSFTDQRFIKGVQSMDLAAFVCRSYPLAAWPKLRVMGLYLVGLIIFDDVFDRKIDPKVADAASDLNISNRYRQDMFEYMMRILEPSAPDGSETGEPTPVCGFFAAIAPHLLGASDRVNIPRLLEDLQFFMGPSNEKQQRFTLERRFPSLNQYNDFRAGTGAVDAICDLHQYIADIKLPDELAWADEVMTMRNEVNIQTCVSNDLFSLRKELDDMTLISLVPIHMHEKGQSLDIIVADLVQDMYRSADAFDAAAASLRAKSKPYGAKVAEDTDKYVETFETFQTGCVAFYLTSKRFGIANCELSDGSWSIPL